MTTTENRSNLQFTLLSLFECTTLCCVVAAIAGLTGVPASLCLMAFALSIMLRQGFPAVATLSLAFVASLSSDGGTAFFREFVIAVASGLIAVWYIYRRNAFSPAL